MLQQIDQGKSPGQITFPEVLFSEMHSTIDGASNHTAHTAAGTRAAG